MSEVFAIVLGAAVRPDGTPSPTLRRRIERAAALYRDGLVGGIVGTGGVGKGPISEAEAVARFARAQGVPDDAILREDRSRNTRENIAFSLALVPDDASIILVSDGWHLPRARLIARRLGRRATGVAASRHGASPAGTARLVLREAGALIWEIARPMR